MRRSQNISDTACTHRKALRKRCHMAMKISSSYLGSSAELSASICSPALVMKCWNSIYTLANSGTGRAPRWTFPGDLFPSPSLLFPATSAGKMSKKNQKIGPEQSPQLPGRASPAGPALPQHYRALNSRFSLFTVELPGGVCSAAASACWEKSGKIRAGAALFVFTWI